MRTTSFIGLILVLPTVSSVLVSCKKSSEPTAPVVQTQVIMQVIPLQDTPNGIDSTVFYKRVYVDWHGPLGGLDTTKADSVANWFAGTSFPITDMWFPNSVSMCLSPFPDNIVTIKLDVPDTTIKSHGFTAISTAFGPCWLYYRHYTFIRTKVGA